MFVLLFLFVLFVGTFAEDECDFTNPYQKCLHHVPREQMNQIKVVPDKDELMSICPGHLRYFECFFEYIEECGRMNEHFNVIQFIENSYEIAQELCSEDSDLHRAYVASAECYKSLEGAGIACEEEAKEIYRVYFEYLKKEHPERVEGVHKSSQQMCMIQSYKTACLSEKVLTECGETAQSTLMEIISRSQYHRQFCSLSMLDELKTTFLDLLDMEEDNLEVYKSAFSDMK